MKPFTKKTPEDNYRNVLDMKADEEEDVRVPDHGDPVSEEMRSLLEFTEPWTIEPDYDRVSADAAQG
jgi:hypothetical protein